MQTIRTLRLTSTDAETGRRLFQLMAAVFEEPCASLHDEYLQRLLSRTDFWAIAGYVDDELVGGLTAHTLPMTRNESSEISSTTLLSVAISSARVWVAILFRHYARQPAPKVSRISEWAAKAHR